MNAKKKALGRGLSALLDNTGVDDIANQISKSTHKSIAGSIANIPLHSIEPNPYQPRTRFDNESLEELTISIKEQGIIQPITVRSIGNEKFQLISGERRFKASMKAGLEEIPAYIRNASDEAVLEMALVENIQRKDLNAIEIALSFQRLIEDCNYTQEELSERVGKNRTTVTNFIRLLKLPANIQMGLQDGKISMGHARAIINVPSIDMQLTIYKDIVDQDLSVRETEEIVRNIENEPEPFSREEPKKKLLTLPIKYAKIKEQLGKQLDMRVDLKRNNKGKGTVIIHFKDDDELEHIIFKIKK
ncbi:MAG TPA: ParB/RepB/Spo0J family partition protein [Bacteroidales bacterium]|nr:ParB/RepB/Spo0J family partition protein [Bacteroidales bacterium]HPS17373.1 ParB/RepB/Spo0J family partition protein [Bacteroidales bacterium]